MKVCKFGGTSLCNAEQFRKVQWIVKSDPSRRYVVVSAPGKRFQDDIKITDLLYHCYEKAVRGEETETLLGEICRRFDWIIRDLGLKLTLDQEYEHIRVQLRGEPSRDYIASRGEYFSAMIMAAFLGYDFVDAAEVILFNRDGSLDLEETTRRMDKILRDHPRAVIPGFYGTDPCGRILTFSRGGGDITGALAARSVLAEVYENWTDVSGFLLASPELFPHARKVDLMSYEDLYRLGRLGAAVFHTDAIAPLKDTGVPTHIRCTYMPEQTGTMICSSLPADYEEEPHVCGIAAERSPGLWEPDSGQFIRLHVIGHRLLPLLSSAADTLKSAGIVPLSISEEEKDLAFEVRKEQTASAAAALYGLLAEK